ncbi:MAG: 3-phosphoshikimate 1-carboxyvinyltransferase [Candidatus Fimivivens sp.]|nr:3-phosphoshikimate 1-carboxyvinyltransferase [Candidatus Fimivivens sp.]
MDIKITPSPLHGALRAVTSKSDAHRCLICAALCDSPTEVVIHEMNRDIAATMKCLSALSADFSQIEEGVWRVTPMTQRPARAILDCGESGSTLRFLLPVAAAVCKATRVEGAGRLPQRPLSPLREEMEAHGSNFDAAQLPFTVTGPLAAGVFTLPGNISSQYITGLLFALPLLAGDSDILLTTPLESAGYVSMTLRTLAQFNIDITTLPNGGGYHIKGGQRYCSPTRIAAEGDWSNAAFWLAAGAMHDSVTVTALNTDTAQGDSEIIPLLQRFGALTEANGGHATASPQVLSGITIDAGEIPDLVPVLSVVACAAVGTTKIINAARLRIKESDRLQTIADSLNALGGSVYELPDGLIIEGTGRLRGGVVNSFNDHRIAMAMSIASTICTEDVIIQDAAAVEKSYPKFFDDFKKLGGKADVV